MAKAVSPSKEERPRAAERAREWKLFRQTYLYSQNHLAHALHCGRRTVCAIASGREVYRPRFDLLRRFRDLKRRQERANGAFVAPAHTSDHLLERRA